MGKAIGYENGFHDGVNGEYPQMVGMVSYGEH